MFIGRVKSCSASRKRAQDYAFDDMELADDMRCVAVPVFGKDGNVARGISLSGPLSRFSLQW